MSLKISAYLEQNDLACWYAPRDVKGNKPWPEELAQAIHDSIAVLVISTEMAASSHYVVSEITLAVSDRKAIIPIVVGGFKPSGSLRLLLSTHQWVPCDTQPTPEQFSAIESHIRRLLEIPKGKRHGSADRRRSVSQGAPPTRSRSWKTIFLTNRPKWIVSIIAFAMIFALAIWAYFRFIPEQVNQHLSSLWRMDQFQTCYEQSRTWQGAFTLRDKSIPAYWRIVSYQSMTFPQWSVQHQPNAIAALDQEFRSALTENTSGARADGLLYQFAHFRRRVGDDDAAIQTFERIQREFPSSAWKEGTAYYYARLALAHNNQPLFESQIQRLRNMSLDGRIYSFEDTKYILVRDGISRLEEQATQPAIDAFHRE